MDPQAEIPSRAPAVVGRVDKLASRGAANESRLVWVLGARSAISVSGRPDERIAAIARFQRGVVSRRQLKQAGLTDSAIDRRVARGTLLPLHRGVFAVGHKSNVDLAAETAAILAMRPGAVLSTWSAAILWGLLLPGAGDGQIHVLVSANPAGHPTGVRVHRTRILTPKDTRIHKSLPVTSPARTLLDLAPLLTPRQLERTHDHALVHHLTRPTHLTELLTRTTGHPGHRPLTHLQPPDQNTTPTRSQAEELFLHLIRQARLPQPEINQHLHGYETDFLWRPQHLIVETDGYQYHSTRTTFEADHHRDTTLTAHGYTTLRSSWRQLKEEPLAVVATVARALA